jgi:hypothetical protein
MVYSEAYVHVPSPERVSLNTLPLPKPQRVGAIEIAGAGQNEARGTAFTTEIINHRVDPVAVRVCELINGGAVIAWSANGSAVEIPALSMIRPTEGSSPSAPNRKRWVKLYVQPDCEGARLPHTLTVAATDAENLADFGAVIARYERCVALERRTPGDSC